MKQTISKLEKARQTKDGISLNLKIHNDNETVEQHASTNLYIQFQFNLIYLHFAIAFLLTRIFFHPLLVRFFFSISVSGVGEKLIR